MSRTDNVRKLNLDVSESVRENEQLKERIKALEDIVKSLVTRISHSADSSPTQALTISHSEGNKSHDNLPSTTTPTSSIQSSVKGDIDLRPSRIRSSRQDDLRCVERLRRSDHGHPHVRLGLLWHIVYTWCDQVRGISVETWLRIIEGSDEDRDVWLWEDGDELILSKLLFRKPEASDLEYHAPVFLYAVTLRKSLADLTADDWKQAMNALQCRLDRNLPSAPFVNGPTAVTRSSFAEERIQASIWLLLFSKPMREADLQRGVRRLLCTYDDRGLLNRWIQIHHLFHKDYDRLIHMNFIADMDDFCADVKKWLGDQGEWTALLSMFYDLEDIRAVWEDMSFGVFCDDDCQCLFRSVY